MLLGVYKPQTLTTILASVYEARRASEGRGARESGENAGGEMAEGSVEQVHTHTPLAPNGDGEEVLARLLVTAQDAKHVIKAMVNEYGSTRAMAALHNVRDEVRQTENRRLEEGMTLSDLELLYRELRGLDDLQELRNRVPDERAGGLSRAEEPHAGRLQELRDRDLRELRDRGPNDTPGAVKDELAENWASAAKEEYCPVQWLNSGATVGLRHSIYEDLIQRDDMRFRINEWTGALVLAQGDAGHSEEDKMVVLTEFIGEHFDVEPGHPAFPNIANNILSYLPLGPTAEAKAREFVRNYVPSGARPADGPDRGIVSWVRGEGVERHPGFAVGDHVRSFFKLSMEDGNVEVVGEMIIPLLDILDADGLSDYTLQRDVKFVISGEHLMIDPTAFDAKANLVSVEPSDSVVTVGFARTPVWLD